MSGTWKELSIFKTHEFHHLPYLGEVGVAEQMATAADVLLITSHGHELPAHRVFLLRHSRVRRQRQREGWQVAGVTPAVSRLALSGHASCTESWIRTVAAGAGLNV